MERQEHWTVRGCTVTTHYERPHSIIRIHSTVSWPSTRHMLEEQTQGSVDPQESAFRRVKQICKVSLAKLVAGAHVARDSVHAMWLR